MWTDRVTIAKHKTAWEQNSRLINAVTAMYPYIHYTTILPFAPIVTILCGNEENREIITVASYALHVVSNRRLLINLF